MKIQPLVNLLDKKTIAPSEGAALKTRVIPQKEQAAQIAFSGGFKAGSKALKSLYDDKLIEPLAKGVGYLSAKNPFNNATEKLSKFSDKKIKLPLVPAFTLTSTMILQNLASAAVTFFTLHNTS
ncbi:hypothetical protein tpqmel_0999, partial [Candidatus Gastranaerophilus sp. (ex Termes propinquus)]